jgi:hypothetical protein
MATATSRRPEVPPVRTTTKAQKARYRANPAKTMAALPRTAAKTRTAIRSPSVDRLLVKELSREIESSSRTIS